MQIPNITNYELTVAMKNIIEKALKSIPYQERNNLKLVRKSVENQIDIKYKNILDMPDLYQEELNRIGIYNTLDIDKAIWRFFVQYHKR